MKQKTPPKAEGEKEPLALPFSPSSAAHAHAPRTAQALSLSHTHTTTAMASLPVIPARPPPPRRPTPQPSRRPPASPPPPPVQDDPAHVPDNDFPSDAITFLDETKAALTSARDTSSRGRARARRRRPQACRIRDRLKTYCCFVRLRAQSFLLPESFTNNL